MHLATSRIPCNLSWPVVIKNHVKLRETMELSHRRKFDQDYDYLGNVDIDADKLIASEHKEIRIVTKPPYYSSLTGRQIKINSPELDDLRRTLGLVDYTGSVQNLEPHKFVPAHYDSPSETVEEGKTPSLLTKYYLYLKDKHGDNFENLSVDDLFNIAVIFLEPWAHGQAFLVGRSSITNWKVGDVASFPWYMPHSTINGSDKNRHIIFMSGSFK